LADADADADPDADADAATLPLIEGSTVVVVGFGIAE
jgi:hypothetical protein